VSMTWRPRGVRRDLDDVNALTDSELAGRVYRLARCAGSPVDPDVWFPVGHDVAKARDEAAPAIAVCARCPVRLDCLELSLRNASGIGAHGVWGGLVEEERRFVRRRWLAGTSVTELLRDQPVRLPARLRGHPPQVAAPVEAGCSQVGAAGSSPCRARMSRCSASCGNELCSTVPP
jgi:WhiB family redox-sensing transcriptional regulator